MNIIAFCLSKNIIWYYLGDFVVTERYSLKLGIFGAGAGKKWRKMWQARSSVKILS